MPVPKLQPRRPKAVYLKVPTASDRVYHTERWARLSRAIRRRRRTCERCQLALTEHVHHIVPIDAQPALAFEATNLQALCGDCHRAIHRAQRPLLG